MGRADADGLVLRISYIQLQQNICAKVWGLGRGWDWWIVVVNVDPFLSVIWLLGKGFEHGMY